MLIKIIKIQRLRFLAFILDIFFLVASLLLSYCFRFTTPINQGAHELIIYTSSFVSLCCLYILGTFDLQNEDSVFLIITKQILAIIISSVIVVSFAYLSRSEISGILGRGVFLLGNLFFIVISSIYKSIIGNYLKKIKKKWNWYAFGNSPLIERLLKDLKNGSTIGSVTIHKTNNTPEDSKIITSELENNWSGIIVATNNHLDINLSKELLHKKLNGLLVTDLFQLYEKFWHKIPVFYLEDRWFLTIDGFSISYNRISLRIKRLFDVIISLIVFMITWPILIITSVAIKLDSDGPIFFKQIRTGKDGKLFEIFKFRSMVIDAEKNGAQWAQTNDSRVTRIGKIIRLYRIDELPQIINVIRGDMSFIGPRPERPEFNSSLEVQIPYYQLRHLVQPGITGWAQVLYPYGSSIEDTIEKLQYDLYYIKNYSFWLDCKILIKTIKVIIFGKGR